MVHPIILPFMQVPVVTAQVHQRPPAALSVQMPVRARILALVLFRWRLAALIQVRSVQAAATGVLIPVADTVSRAMKLFILSHLRSTAYILLHATSLQAIRIFS